MDLSAPAGAWPIVPADRLPDAQLHAAFGAAFADYLLGPFAVPLQQWPRFLRRQGVVLADSRVALGTDGVLAFALVAPRADVRSWRLGTMGALPAARGSGAAPALLDDFIARAAAAGQRHVELECFAQNERALRLYRGRGFEELSPLYGHRGDAVARTGSAAGRHAVHAVDLADAWAWLDRVSRRRGDLPFQVTPPSLQAQPFPLQAWRCGDAQLVAGESAEGQLTIVSLVDEQSEQAGAESLVRDLLDRYPDHAINVPQLQRPDLGGQALERIGFARLPLHQLYLRRPLP